MSRSLARRSGEWGQPAHASIHWCFARCRTHMISDSTRRECVISHLHVIAVRFGVELGGDSFCSPCFPPYCTNTTNRFATDATSSQNDHMGGSHPVRGWNGLVGGSRAARGPARERLVMMRQDSTERARLRTISILGNVSVAVYGSYSGAGWSLVQLRTSVIQRRASVGVRFFIVRARRQIRI